MSESSTGDSRRVGRFMLMTAVALLGMACGRGTPGEEDSAYGVPVDAGLARCGDGTCNENEDPWSCSDDCRCGDGVCSTGESCPADCKTPAVRCGDGLCAAGEDPGSCPADCHPAP